MQRLIDLIQDPIKAFITTITGTLFGYIPSVPAVVYNTQVSPIDIGLQHTVWTLTGIVAIFAIISGVQKQIDRYRKNHSFKDIFESDEEDGN